MRRGIGIFAALTLAVAIGLLALTATAGAQEGTTDEGNGSTPACAPDETCIDPPPPCYPIEICQGAPIDCPTTDPDVICATPPDCPKDAPCTSPGCPPDGTPCVNPPPCPDGEICVDPQPIPPPCDGRDCQFDDTDGDGWQDFTENAWGSDAHDAASTPEHGYVIETCSDGVDNDRDGAADSADDGCRIDSDGDGAMDLQDNCPWDANADQTDRDGDGIGDACDYDADNDGWDDYTEGELGSNANDASSVPEHWYVRETCEDGADNDGDGMIDAADPGCAPDNDYDGIADANDNCPTYWNPDQVDTNGDGVGDACTDTDGDGFFDGDEVAWGSDPADATSVPEGGVNWDACTDGADNDHDGTVDGDDEGCRVTFEDGPAPPTSPGDGQPVPVSVTSTGGSDSNTTTTTTNVSALPEAGSGPGHRHATAWWLVAASLGVLALVSGTALVGAGVRNAR